MATPTYNDLIVGIQQAITVISAPTPTSTTLKTEATALQALITAATPVADPNCLMAQEDPNGNLKATQILPQSKCAALDPTWIYLGRMAS